MHISLKAETLFNILGLKISNSLVLAIIASLILTVFALILRKKIRLIPGKLQIAVEIAIGLLLVLMSSVLGSREKSEKYFPIVATIFIFVLASNWLGLLPGIGSLVFHQSGGETVPLLRSPSADLNFTMAIAVFSVLIANFFGAVSLGVFPHIKKFFNFSSPINFFVGILEGISEMAKVVSFSFRLFGNIFAGEVLMIIISFLLPYAAPVPFIFLEIFFGSIQAFIFAMLTLVFLSVHTTIYETNH